MSGKVPTRSIHGFWRYRLLKTLTKNFHILSNAASAATDVDADAVVTAIALPVLSYRRAKNWNTQFDKNQVGKYPICQILISGAESSWIKVIYL